MLDVKFRSARTSAFEIRNSMFNIQKKYAKGL
jgi:hypothetical protein